MNDITKLSMEALAEQLYQLPLMRLEKAFESIYVRDLGFAETILSTLSRVIPTDNAPFLRQVGQKYDWRYGDCISDSKGYYEVSKYRPLPFDMTVTKVKRAKDTGFRDLTAWWTGKEWTGLRLKAGDKVVKWKLEPRGM